MADSLAKTIFLFFCFFKMDSVKKGCGVGAKKFNLYFLTVKLNLLHFTEK